MKATIQGKTYNTDTAELIASDSARGSTSDFSFWEEELYVTTKGAHFLFGSGGPLSRYSSPAGNNSYEGGSRIIPMSREEALTWCEEHECEKAISEHFSDLVVEA
jgi:hypothetical protein